MSITNTNISCDIKEDIKVRCVKYIYKYSVIYKGISRFGVSNTNTNINRNANAIYDRILRFPGLINSIEASAEALDAATTLRLGSATSLGRAFCLRLLLKTFQAILSREVKTDSSNVPSRLDQKDVFKGA